ncbi:Solute-binding protein family 3 domain-containing protein, MltF-like [Desulfonema limicola]|uniref:Solute-binding protein family 3 domain-containing protein, MltF-like n=1 Tax=Desulfonema limicola TaxID=45656 RepID=A0A975BBQ9_9BACT|nr:transporter substrate-binding domain-containing protein [Desulfonema limicola]QTA82325.1 Solute-binding protein family 3 domain-containing protein, MltF-like [Desulfonema limicola]
MERLLKIFIKRFVLLILLSFIIGLFVTSGIQAENNSKTIHIATIDYPPLMGVQNGVMTEIVTEAFKSQGFTIEYKIYPMARIVWSVTEGNDLAVVGSRAWFHKADTIKNVHPVSIYFTGLNFFSLKEKFPQGVIFEKLEDLKNYKIGYVRGGSLIPIFNKANLTPELVTTLSQNASKVYTGRIDMFAATELGGWGVIQKSYPDEVDKFTISKKHIHQINGDIVFAKDQIALMNIFQQGFETIKNNGTYLNILKKYYINREIPNQLLEFIK